MNRKRAVNRIPATGPWITKSKGHLKVLFNFSQNATTEFIDSTTNENPLYGLRAYHISSLKKGCIGANEWHKLRTELIFITKGEVRWECIDQNGKKDTYILSPESDGLRIPPNTLHTYTSLEDDSEILVIANTCFDPENSETHDTYPASDFE